MNFSDRGLQLTRTCRALKVWISLQHFGVGAFRAAIDACFDLAQHAEQRIAAEPELELMTPASLGIVSFRRHPAGIDDDARLDQINAEPGGGRSSTQGDVFVSTGSRARAADARLCILNHSTSQAEVDRAIELAATLPAEVGRARGAGGELPADRPRRAAAPGAVGGTLLRALPLFGSLSDDQADEGGSNAAREHHAVAGEPIVEQWQVSRDLFVVLDGEVEVTADGTRITTSGPGEFFGELAAVDGAPASHGPGRRRSRRRGRRDCSRGLGARQVADEHRARVRRAARAGVARASRATLTLCQTSHTASRVSGTVSS